MPGPKFHPFRSTASRFQDIVHFIIFPLNPMLKCQSITNCFKLVPIAKKSNTLHSPIVANALMKFE